MNKITLSFMGIAIMLLMNTYDLFAQNYREVGNMNQPRDWCAYVMLNDGTILACGGVGGGNTAEIFDPATETWTQVADMNLARNFHTATLLDDGRVFVMGGVSGTSDEERTGEIYNPTTDSWTTTSLASCPRSYQDAMLLSDGNVWLTGGGCSQSEIYDVAQDTFYLASNINGTAYSSNGTLIKHTDGKFMIIGGKYPVESNGKGATILESGDPYSLTDSWTPSANEMSLKVAKASVYLKSDGKYAVVDDYGGTVHTFDPGTYTFGSASSTYGSVPRHAQASTQMMADGRLIAFGGSNPVGEFTGVGTETIQVFDWTTNSWSAPYIYNEKLPVFTASIRLQSGLILAFGGTEGPMNSNRTFIIDENGTYTDIDDVEDQGFAPKLYPNPAQDMLQVELSLHEPSDVSISISDMLGKELSVLSESALAGSVKQQINVAGYPSGLYTITVESNGTTYSQPFVKQ